MILFQLTDLHCSPYGERAMRRCETNTLTERAFRTVSRFRPQPDAIVVTGDLSDDGSPASYQELSAILRRTTTRPVYVIPGNHDERGAFRTHLAHLPGVNDHPDFVQYTVENLPVRLVMLDTLVPGEPHGELNAAQLAWLDATLAAAPDRPTMIAMHHPPFLCGIRHLDRINLRDTPAFTAVIARHPQVRRIICGHHHRPITMPVAHAIATISPGVAHQAELELLNDAVGQWNLEPPAFQIHLWLPEAGAIASHTALVESWPGPYPFLAADPPNG